jgi:hypothetical protein
LFLIAPCQTASRMPWLDTWFVPVAVRYIFSELCHQAGQGLAWAQGLSPDWEWDTLASLALFFWLARLVVTPSACWSHSTSESVGMVMCVLCQKVMSCFQRGMVHFALPFFEVVGVYSLTRRRKK